MVSKEKLNSSFQLASGGISTYNYFSNPNETFTNVYDLETVEVHAIEKTLISVGTLLMSLSKEEILGKDDNRNLTLLVNEDEFDRLISKVCTCKDNKYYIGNISFDSKLDVLEFLRNKLLHGDYYLNNDKIYFAKDEDEGYINYNDFFYVCINIGTLSKSNDVVNTDYFVLLNHLECDTLESKLENDFSYVTINDRIIEGNKRSIEYNDFIVELKKYIRDLNTIYGYMPSEAVEEALIKFDNEIAIFNTEITYEINLLSSHPRYLEIKEYICSDESFYKKNEKLVPSDILYICIDILLNENRLEREYTAYAYKNIFSFLVSYINGEMAQPIHYISSSFTWIDDMTIAALLLCFYGVYHYGLDEIYNGEVNTLLKDVIFGRKLDYSKLNLEKFYDSNMTIENSCDNFWDEIDSLRRDMYKRKAIVNKTCRNLENYKLNSRVVSPAKIERLETNFSTAKEEYEKGKNLLDKASNFDIDLYVKNLNVINHIRNAFAHGNVRIEPYKYGDTLTDRNIIIEDIYNGVITYKLKINYVCFRNLFIDSNLNYVYDFLRNLSDVQYDKTVGELMIREIICGDLDGIIYKEKQEEWKGLVEENINSMERLNVLYFAFNDMEFIANSDDFSPLIDEIKGIEQVPEHLSLKDMEEIVNYILEYSVKGPLFVRKLYGDSMSFEMEENVKEIENRNIIYEQELEIYDKM